MKRPLLFKFLAIGFLMLLLLIPISMIGSSIDERQAYNDKVVSDIARSSSYKQTLIGPILIIPYEKTERKWATNDKNERIVTESQVAGELYFLPSLYRFDGDLATEQRQRGIYKAHLYHAAAQIKGNFDLPLNFGVTDNLSDYTFLTPYVAMGISDIRGIESAVKFTFNAKYYEVEPGSYQKNLGEGVHAYVDALPSSSAQVVEFSMTLGLQGTESISFAPLGKDTQIELRSDWPHPSFIGDYLPVNHTINDSGFSAHWQTSYFSTNMAEHFNRCMAFNNCTTFNKQRFGVSFIDPVNQYVKSDRAIKYALLFIALTFAGFFLFEVLKRLQIHPVQYGLVGLALAFFYLLLLSLSEHLGFALSYGISAVACILLIGFYVIHVLHSFKRGFGFTLGLGGLYFLLYGLLSAEDYALLMGAILLFALLGVFMMLTRKVDWYAVGQIKKAQEGAE